MLRNTPKLVTKSKNGSPQNNSIKSKQMKNKKASIVRKSLARNLSTILTGEPEPIFPVKKKPTTPIDRPEVSQPPQQMSMTPEGQEQLQGPPPQELNFNDPQVVEIVGSFNSFIRNKSSPVFHKALQSLLVAHDVVPFPTKDDFIHPQKHILKSLIDHNLVLVDTDVSKDDIPQEVLHNSPINPAQHATVEQLYDVLDLFKIFHNTEGIKYKPGKVNIYQQFKPGNHTTDPATYNKAQVEAKIKSAKRLGLDTTANQGDTVLDIVLHCIETSGGLDFREYIVTEDRPHSHHMFFDRVSKIPPPGELLSSDFSKNTCSPFSQQLIHAIPNGLQYIQELGRSLENQKDVSKLAQMSKQVMQYDMLSVWKKQNKDLHQRFEQSAFNPLLTFNDEDISNIHTFVFRQFLQKLFTMHYLFSPFQLAYVSLPATISQTSEQLTKYYRARDNALYDIEPTDSSEIQQRKRGNKLPIIQPMEKLVSLTEFPGYQAIWSGKSNLIIENISETQSDSLSAKFNEMLIQNNLFNYKTFQDRAVERFPDLKQGTQVEPKVMLSFLKEELGNNMVKYGVFAKKSKLQKDAGDSPISFVPKKTFYGLQFNPSLSQTIINEITDDGYVHTDPTTGKKTYIKIYELELLKHMRRFGIITPANEDEFVINTLSPIILPDEQKEDIELKQKLIDSNFFTVHHQGIQLPHLPGQKHDLSDPNSLSPFQNLLLCTLYAEVRGGDNDPNSSFPLPVDDDQLHHVVQAGHAKVISEDSQTGRKIARAIEKNWTPEISGWVRNAENDVMLGDGAINHVDNALFSMNIHQLREFSTQQYVHEVAVDAAQRHPETFSLFTRDMHTIALPDNDMNEMRFMASQMATQMLLRAKFRQDQDMSTCHPLYPKPVYGHVLFTSPAEYDQSKHYFLSKANGPQQVNGEKH